MQKGIILTGDKLNRFCKELNINPTTSKILIKIKKNNAEYYNPNVNILDTEIAKKYI